MPSLPPAQPVRTVAAIKVDGPGKIATDGTAIWVTTRSGAERIDPRTNKATAIVKLGNGSDDIEGIGADAQGAWATDFSTGQIDHLDGRTGALLSSIAVASPEFVATSADSIWVTNHHDGSVTRIDPNSGVVVATVSVGHAGNNGPQGISLGFGSVWVGISNVQGIARIDPASNKVQVRIRLPETVQPCGGIAITNDAVWISSCYETTVVSRIDPSTNQVAATVDLGGHTGDPFVVAGGVWFPVEDHEGVPAELVQIDPMTDGVTRALDVAQHAQPLGTVVLGNSLWLVDMEGGRVLRLSLADLATP